MVGLMIAGLVLNLGGGPNHDRIGFRYWRDPGPFVAYIVPGAKGEFLGWFTTLPWAAYSYVGIEAIGIAVAEVKNPRRTLPRAIKRVFYRIAIFYVGGILIVGMLIPSTQAGLLQRTGTAASSPWVLAFHNAGVRVWPSIINAFFLVFAFSACNTAMYVGSRALYGLALRGQAPKVFAHTSRRGTPYVAATVLALFLPLAYMSVSQGAATVFGWFVNLTALTSFITWLMISLTCLRFHAACRVHGVSRGRGPSGNAGEALGSRSTTASAQPTEAGRPPDCTAPTTLPYTHGAQPYLALWAIFWSSVIIVFNGWRVFTRGNWNTVDFVVAYINVPITLALVGVYCILWRPRVWTPVRELDLWTGVPRDEEVEEGVGEGAGEEEKRAWWRRAVRACFGFRPPRAMRGAGVHRGY